MHHMANRLSSEPNSAGANFLAEDFDEANYGIGIKFGGKARKALKVSAHETQKRKLEKLLASQNGCYVCGGDHMARQCHTPQEILEANERIKRKNPSALFSVDEVIDMQFALVSKMPESDRDDQEDGSVEECLDNHANLISEDSNDELGRTVYNHFANVAFVHCRKFASDLKKEMEEIDAVL